MAIYTYRMKRGATPPDVSKAGGYVELGPDGDDACILAVESDQAPDLGKIGGITLDRTLDKAEAKTLMRIASPKILEAATVGIERGR